MARPFKEGLDYFPLDVDFLEDKKIKLIKVEFGAKGILVLMSLLSLIYKNNGYFYEWDNDDCYLMSDGVGCGCSPEFIREVLQGCIRRSIFNDRVFNMFGVLTSVGIQKRFIKAVSERQNIIIIKEYWLVDLSDKKIFSTGILKKIVINSINPPINEVNKPINEVNPPINPQSKVKKSKVNIKDNVSPSGEDEDDHKKIKFELDSFEIKAVDYLISKILEMDSKRKVPDSIEKKQAWADDINKIKRLDKRTEDEIRSVLKFATEDGFWKKNILSASKFRTQFSRLYIDMNTKNTPKVVKINKSNKFHNFNSKMAEMGEEQLEEIAKRRLEKHRSGIDA